MPAPYGRDDDPSPGPTRTVDEIDEIIPRAHAATPQDTIAFLYRTEAGYTWLNARQGKLDSPAQVQLFQAIAAVGAVDPAFDAEISFKVRRASVLTGWALLQYDAKSEALAALGVTIRRCVKAS
jgi:hypothetical protein